MNGFTVVDRAGKTYITGARGEDMDSAKLDRLCDLLEKFLAQQNGSEEEEAEDELVPISAVGGEGNSNPISSSDAKITLQNLKNLRPFVERNGDRKAIDAFNNAVKAVRVQVALAERYEAHHATDSRRNAKSEAASFEVSAAKFLGKAVRLHGEVNDSTGSELHAEDSETQELSFDDLVAKAREKSIARFTPKKRR
jgi:hypothetical protein